MKLWQKIFFISLAVVLAATGCTSIVVLSGYFSSTVQREERNVVQLHEYLSSAMAGSVVWQRFSDGVPRLAEDRVREILLQQAKQQNSFECVYLVNERGEPFGTDPSFGVDEELARQLAETDSVLSVIRSAGNRKQLTVASHLLLEGQKYLLFTVADTTEIYRQCRTEAANGLLLTIAFALGIAALLFFVCYVLLRPLTKVNETLGVIAGGDYGRRMPETGGPEFRELSHSVNSMAGAIEEQMEKLRANAESRKRFADSMAHEMKTPLTSILCMADLLQIKKEVDEAERREYAGVIVEEARRMKELSSKLLTIASADGTALDLRPISSAALIGEVCSIMSPLLARKGISLLCAGDDGWFAADRSLFQTLLINLIDNAAKASAEGQRVGIYYTVSNARVLIAVADEGKGMDQETLRHATEPFYMADKARSRKEGGAGLGLFLCSEVAKLHGASLQFDSEPGKGTTVTVEIPTCPTGEEELA